MLPWFPLNQGATHLALVVPADLPLGCLLHAERLIHGGVGVVTPVPAPTCRTRLRTFPSVAVLVSALLIPGAACAAPVADGLLVGKSPLSTWAMVAVLAREVGTIGTGGGIRLAVSGIEVLAPEVNFDLGVGLAPATAEDMRPLSQALPFRGSVHLIRVSGLRTLGVFLRVSLRPWPA